MHISELAPFRIRSVREVVNIGDVIPVSVRETDEQGVVLNSLSKTPTRIRNAKGGYSRRTSRREERGADTGGE